MKTNIVIGTLAVACLFAAENSAQAALVTWASSAGNTNWTSGTSWTGGTAPSNSSSADTAVFTSVSSAQPYMDATNRGILGIDLQLASGGFNITSGATGRLNVGTGGIDATNQLSGTNAINVATFQFANGNSGAIYSLFGTNNSTATDSTFNLASSTILLNGGTGTIEIQSRRNAGAGNGKGIVNISGAISGSNTGTVGLLFNGSIAAGTFNKDYNFVYLTGNSSFDSRVALNGITVTVNSLANAGTSSALGTNGDIVLGGTGGTFSATANKQNAALVFSNLSSNGSTDRKVLFSSSSGVVTHALVNNDSTYTVAFNYTGDAMDSAGSTGARTIEFGGINTGDNTFAEKIGDPTGTTGAVLKTGTGKWVLTGSNSYTGATTISNGTLALGGASGALAAGTTVAISNGATFDVGGRSQQIAGLTGAGNVTNSSGALTVSNAANGTYSGVMSGAGGLTKTGAGTLTLSGANTYSGATTITAGQITINNADVIGDSSAVTINGGTLDLGAKAETLYSINMSSGTLLRGGTNLTLLNASSFTGGTVTLSAAASRINTTNTTTLGDVSFNYSSGSANNYALVLGGNLAVNASTTANITNGGGGAVRLNLNDAVRTFDVGSAGHLNLDWVVWSTTASSGGITKTGTGTLTLGRANLFTGGFTLSDGVVRAGDAAALGASTGPITLNGGTIASTDGTARTFANKLTIGGDVTFGQASGGTGVLTFSSTNTNNLAGLRTLTTEVDTTIAGFITNGSITKAGNATLYLTNAQNSFSNLTVNAGSVAFQTNATVTGLAGSGSGALNVAGGTLTVYASTNSTFGQVISGAGGLTKSGSGTLTLSASNSYSGATTVSAGRLALSGTNTSSAILVTNTGTLSGTGRAGNVVVASGGLIAPGNSPGNLTVGNFEMAGGGGYQWEITNVSGAAGTEWDLITITGNTTISATSGNKFTIYITGSGVTGWDASTNNTWVIMDWGGGTAPASFDENVFALNTTSFTDPKSGVFSLSTNSTSLLLTYNGASGTPTYSGTSGVWSTGFTPAIVNNGDAIFDGGPGTATNDIASATLNTVGSITFATNAAGSYTLTAASGSSGFDTNSALAVVGNIVNNSAYAQTNNLAISLSGASIVNAASNDITLGGGIIGAGSIAKTGDSLLLLSGDNSYTGATTISNGTVRLGSAAALGATNSGTTLVSGATLDLNGQTVGNEALSMAGTGVGGNGALINSSTNAASLAGAVTLTGATAINTTNAAGNITLGGAVGGTGSLTKTGAGTLLLSVSNNYSGGTVLNAGTIGLGASYALGSGLLTIGDGTQLASIAGTRTLTNAVLVNGNFSLGGFGAATTFTGGLDLGGADRTISLSNSATFGGVVSNGGLILSGGGYTLTMNAANTFAGGLTLSGGGSANVTFTLAGALVSTSPLTMHGTGDLTISNITASSFTVGSLAGTNVNANINLGAKNLIVGGNNASTSFAGVITNTGSLTKAGTGTLTLSSAHTYSGATTISNGEIALSGSGKLSTSTAINLAGASSRFDISGIAATGSTNGSLAGVAGSVVNLGSDNLNVGGDNSSTTFAGALTNTGSLTKSGTGTMTLSGTNTYSGATTVSAGTLAIASSGAYSTNSLTTVAAGATLDITNSGVAINTALTGNFLNLVGTANIANAGWTNAGAATSKFYVNGGTLNIGSGGTVSLTGGSDGVDIRGGGTISIASGGALATSLSSSSLGNTGNNLLTNAGTLNTAGFYAGSGAAGLNQLFNSGLWTNTGNLYVGYSANSTGTNRVINQGTFTNSANIIMSYLAATTGTNVFLNQGDINSSATSFILGNQGSAYNVFSNTAGTAILATNILLGAGSSNNLNEISLANGTVSGTMWMGRQGTYQTNSVTVSGGTMSNASINMGTGYASGTNPASYNLNRYIVNGGSAVAGTITMGSGYALVGTNTNIITLNGGVLVANSIVLGAQSASNGDTNSIVFNGGTLQAGSSAAANFLTNGVAAVTLDAGGGTIDSSNKAITVGATIGGAGALTKSGNGTLTLSGANSYSGGTTLGAGTLRLAGTTAAGTGTITQSSGASTLEINTTGTVANAMSIFNISTLQSVTLSGNKTLNNATYTVAAATTTTESGVLSGPGGITKEGTGTLVVTASNSFTGATVVNAGTLDLNSATGSALGASTNVSVAATLLISQNNQVDNTAAVSLSGGTIRTAAGVSEVFGDLSVTGSGFLDFGTTSYANANTISFGTYTPSALLTIDNFNFGSTMIFKSDLSSSITNSAFFTFNTGGISSYSWNDGTSTFTITAIPEPSTYLAAVGLLGLMLWPSRRRLVKDAKAILGLRAPMRDRLARR